MNGFEIQQTLNKIYTELTYITDFIKNYKLKESQVKIAELTKQGKI